MIRKLTAIIFLMLCTVTVAAQQATVTARYVYDANGRLRAVITPEGAAIYEYDAAGNFTRIRRLGMNACEILEFTPRQGPFGALVTIYGIGFDQATEVSFNGKAAEIVSKSAISVVARVPAGAETGPVSITLPCGRKTFESSFTVSGVLVLPATIAVTPNRTVQYSATVAGLADSGVIWSVNGIEGGNETLGTITGNGLYTAPAQEPNSSTTYTIRAVSVIEASIFGEAQAKVTGGGYEFFAQGVSVRYGIPANNVVAYTATPVAVRYSPPDTSGRAFVAAPLSVRYGNTEPSAPAFITNAISARYGSAAPSSPVQLTTPVSVRYGAVADSMPAYTPVHVSVRYGSPPDTASVSSFTSVSVSKSPSVTGVSLPALTKGTTVSLTIRGRNLSEATEIRFVNEDGTPDAEITVSEIRASENGASLKVRVSVTGKATAGRRMIRITTASGASQVNPTSSNTIEITP